MQRIIRITCLVGVVLGVGIVMQALADNTDTVKTDDDYVAEAKTKLLAEKFLVGKLTKVSAESKTFGLKVSYFVRVPDAEAWNQYKALDKQFRVAAAQKNEAEMAKLKEQYKELEPKLVKEVELEFDVRGADDFKVAKAAGAPARNGTVPSAVANIADLAEGQLVRVYPDQAKLTALLQEEREDTGGPILYPASGIIIMPAPGEMAAPAPVAGGPQGIPGGGGFFVPPTGMETPAAEAGTPKEKEKKAKIPKVNAQQQKQKKKKK